MMGIELIQKYFPDLTPWQIEKFTALQPLYADWNSKINLISRKDIEFLYEKHILHSLSIAKIIQFKPQTKILDVGTGGGFPGIPLAIMFPQCQFTLVDSIGKKIKVVQAIADSLELKNVTAINARVETIHDKFDFVLSRAVTEFPIFYNWVRNKISKKSFNTLHNGILYLKGGDLYAEINGFERNIKLFNLPDYFKGEFFETKKIVHCKVF